MPGMQVTCLHGAAACSLLRLYSALVRLVLSCLCVCRVAPAYNVGLQRCQSTISGLRRPFLKRLRCTAGPACPLWGRPPASTERTLTPLLTCVAMSSFWPTPAGRLLWSAPERWEGPPAHCEWLLCCGAGHLPPRHAWLVVSVALCCGSKLACLCYTGHVSARWWQCLKPVPPHQLCKRLQDTPGADGCAFLSASAVTQSHCSGQDLAHITVQG